MILGERSQARFSKGGKVAIATVLVCIVQITLNYNLVLVDNNGGVDWSLHSPQFLQKNSQRDPDHALQVASVRDKTDLRKFLLSVPFYVYDELEWVNATVDGQPIQEFVHGSQQKHTDDYWFLKSALEHPLRTRNASEAKLFVIPSLHNLFDSRAFFKSRNLCVQSVCNNKLMKLAAKIVTSSPHFQAHPETHLAVVSHFAHHKSWWTSGMPPLYVRMLQQSSNIHFEDFPTNHPDAWSVPKLHVGRPCPWQGDNKTQDVTLIATFKPNDERFRDRELICAWLKTNDASMIRMEQCGPGPMCPALAHAKLGFHVRGDTPSSSRLFDTILSGTVPIFTHSKQYQVLPEWMDWKAISYFINMNECRNESDFVQQLRAILKDTSTYQEKWTVLMANRHLVDWTGLYPFDTYMYMLQAQLYPATRHDPATFFTPGPTKSILHLPNLVPS